MKAPSSVDGAFPSSREGGRALYGQGIADIEWPDVSMNFPFAGARALRDMLGLEGFEAGRKHVRTLIGRISITAFYRKRNTSAPHPDCKNLIGEPECMS